MTEAHPSISDLNRRDEPHHPAEHHVRDLVRIYAALMVLLVLTVGAAFIHMGSFNIVVALTIAIAKACMVIWVFMHVREGGKIVWIFATAAFVWLGILLVLTMSDYLTRNQVPRGQPYNTDAPFIHSTAEEQPGQPKD
jgi:cytochrome c oxidase subunit 4